MIYKLALKFRHALFDKGWRKQHDSEVPTICIGNVTVGGTGKTPHTEMILRFLDQDGDWASRNIAVLSRGYKRRSKGFQQVDMTSTAAFSGDEPLQIKKKFPGVTVAVDKDRVEGCDFLCHPDKLQTSKKGDRCYNKNFPPADLIILDDAFQHRSLKATVNIVLVDFNRPLSEDKLLPYGSLRDLPSRVRSADIIIVTKCPKYLSDQERAMSIESLKLGKDAPKVFFTTMEYCKPTGIFQQMDTRYIYSQRLILFSGIAQDTPLRNYLSDSYHIVKHLSFADHHTYSKADIKSIENAADKWPTAAVATTEKDAQRILDYPRMPRDLKTKMFQVPIRAVFFSEEEQKEFETTLLGLMK
uniref:Tetraacyldisaccharide 4'-kinase n=1 Tax=uncultured bacterium pUR16A2 TaxID=1204710 RepID=R9QZW4_9BACT|nr:hypothetical protein [uncultured bacterium pUR16A2]